MEPFKPFFETEEEIMRKAALVAAALVFMSFSPIVSKAQKWTWEGPYRISSPNLVEIAADPAGGSLYGVSSDGEVHIIDFTGMDPVDSLPWDLRDSDSVNDMAIGPNGLAYICTDTKVKIHDLAWRQGFDLDPQPSLPHDGNGKPVAGSFSSIALDMHGRLYVLYDTDEAQYLMVGNPISYIHGVSVHFSPHNLRLNSRRRWMTLHINLPRGIHGGEVMVDTIRITSMEIEGMNHMLEEPIHVAPGAPVRAGNGRLSVKFIRHDRRDPQNPQSLNHMIGQFMQQYHGQYHQVLLTVEGRLRDGRFFRATDAINAIMGMGGMH